MQYKRFKRIKRAAAAILSVTLFVSELPQAGIAYAAQAEAYEINGQESEVMTEEAAQSEDSGSGNETAGTEASSTETSDTETPKTEAAETEASENKTTQTAGPESTGDVETESESVKTTEPETERGTSEVETTQEEETGTETETTETETTETETMETETTEIETTETIELETEEQTSIPVPEIDAGVYVPEEKVFHFGDSVSAFSIAAASDVTLTEDENGNYTLNNKDEFLAFCASNQDYKGKTINLDCNVDMKNEAVGFTGTFAGKFNGNGHSIINFKTTAGLFRIVESGATVQNLHISNASLDGTTGAGVIAGRNNGTIENCVVTGMLTATASMDATAGIAAQNDGTIRNCAFSGNITAAEGTEGGGKYISGIAGKNNGTIESCYAVGTITTKSSLVAGIAADNYKVIKKSYNYMNVSGVYSVAGVTAENRDTVEDCRNYGNITLEKASETNEQVGGICAGNTGLMQRSYNYGNVSASGKNAGGIAGYTSRGITECGNYGEITAPSNVAGIAGLSKGTQGKDISKSYNKGKVTGNEGTGIGGILGTVEDNCPVNVVNCYNAGQINASLSADSVGGIAGAFMAGSISNCYNAGNFSLGNEKDKAGSIAGFLGSDATCTETYFKTDSLGAIYNKENESVKGTEYSKSEEELKADAILTLLGSAYAADSQGINGGYPVLTGQSQENYQYLVIYEPNGGCFDRYFDIVDKGSNIAEPVNKPTKNNAEFNGWFEDKAQKTAFGFTSATTGPRVAYAGWEERVSVESMELLNDSATLVVGGTYDIIVKFAPENAVNTKILWKSDDEDTAKVDENGKVTAVRPGEAVITGKLEDKSLATELKFKVTVSSSSVVTWIRDANDDKDNPDYEKDIKNLDIAVGDNYKIEVMISGNDISTEDVIEWSSSDPAIAVVDPIANQVGGPRKATITAKKAGNVKISVRYAPKGKEPIWSTLDVTVRPLATKIHVKLDERDVSGQTVIYDYATSKFVAAGTSQGNRLEMPVADFGIQIEPADASRKVVWEVTPKKDSDGKLLEDEGVIEIDKYTGKIKALSDGTTTITVRATDTGKASATVTVKVMNVVTAFSFKAEPGTKDGIVVVDAKDRILLAGGQKVKLAPQILPANATDKRLTIDSVSNKDILEVAKDKTGDSYTATVKKEVTQDTEVTVVARALDFGPKADGVTHTIKFVIKPKAKKVNIYKGTDLRNPVTDAKIGINPVKDDMAFKLTAKNTPDNSIQMVTWKSTNEAVATVEDNKDGSCTVYAKEKKGEAQIVAMAADGSGTSSKVTICVEQPPSEIVIKGSHKVVKGKTVQLKAEIKPLSASNKEVLWESLNPQVAKVDKGTGVVTGVKAGDTQIIATSKVNSAVSAYYSIEVTEPIKDFKIIEYNDIVYDDDTPAPSDLLVLNGKAIGLDPDAAINEKRLKVYVKPSTACQDITWKSSNEKVAKIGEDGTITAVSLGKAKITATSTDGSGKKATVTINVATLTKSVKISGSHYVGSGKTIQLTAEVGDKDAANKTVNWSSSNPNAVSVDKDGKVTGIRSTGTVTITAEAADGSGASDSYIVYPTNAKSTIVIKSKDEALYPIKDKAIECDMNGQVEGRIELTADVTVGGEYVTDRSVKWSSSNASIATVDENGTVTVIADGTAKITATSTDGYETKETCTLKVTNSKPKITGPTRVAVGKKIKLSAGKTAISSWTSDKTSIATVNSKGQVTAKGKGTVTITALPKSGVAATYEVEVTDAVKAVKIALPRTAQGNLGDSTTDNSAVDNRTYVTGQKLGMDITKGYDGSPQLSLVAVVDGVDDYDGKYVTWKSSKASVAKVDEKGLVTPIKAGTAKITATAADGSGKKATVTIVVAKQVTQLVPADVALAENGEGEVRIAYGKTVQLKVGYKPMAATTKKVTWTVADADKNYVSVNKSNGKVKAKNYINRESKPYATVIATANDNSGAACEFHVYVSRPTKKVEITRKADGAEDTVFAAKSTLGVDIDINGGSVMLGAKFTNTSNQTDDNQTVVWKSGNTKIAKIDSDGRLTGLAMGKTTLTATVQDGTKKQCKINVYVGTLITRLMFEDGFNEKIAALRKGSSLELSHWISARPITATNQTLAYKTSNKKVVQVSSKGKITVKGKGTATITVSTTDGSNISVEIPITIS